MEDRSVSLGRPLHRGGWGTPRPADHPNETNGQARLKVGRRTLRVVDAALVDAALVDAAVLDAAVLDAAVQLRSSLLWAGSRPGATSW
ncbi:hypothetical protein IMCC26207_10578 [Actinobacteria bacterium IMCC26207]|nr:hypothetical protein IMCC26207_10578 [Actinobacteria bacterium IMCC26207]